MSLTADGKSAVFDVPSNLAQVSLVYIIPLLSWHGLLPSPILSYIKYHVCLCFWHHNLISVEATSLLQRHKSVCGPTAFMHPPSSICC